MVPATSVTTYASGDSTHLASRYLRFVRDPIVGVSSGLQKPYIGVHNSIPMYEMACGPDTFKIHSVRRRVGEGVGVPKGHNGQALPARRGCPASSSSTLAHSDTSVSRAGRVDPDAVVGERPLLAPRVPRFTGFAGSRRPS